MWLVHIVQFENYSPAFVVMLQYIESCIVSNFTVTYVTDSFRRSAAHSIASVAVLLDPLQYLMVLPNHFVLHL